MANNNSTMKKIGPVEATRRAHENLIARGVCARDGSGDPDVEDAIARAYRAAREEEQRMKTANETLAKAIGFIADPSPVTVAELRALISYEFRDKEIECEATRAGIRALIARLEGRS